MGTSKKKPGKQNKQPQFKGHYCKICGERKANEKFSGSGHAAHICKACAKMSPEQKSEAIAINRLNSMAFRYISKADMQWLKDRRSDSRPRVQELARQLFEMKFPRQARNEIKARLHIKSMVFHVRGSVYDGYGDEYIVNVEFSTDTSGVIIKKSFDANEPAVEDNSVSIGENAIRKFFNIAVNNYDISFWDTDLCLEISCDTDIDLLPEYRNSDDFDFDDDDFGFVEETTLPDAIEDEAPDDRIPTWSVEIKYKNGTEQSIKGYDYIPDPVVELYCDLDEYFSDKDIPDDEFDEDDPKYKE
jgi:hypothetical protein